MPLSPEHKRRSRQRIIASAVELFTNYGFDNVSIDQIMKKTNMTRGAFYAHFSSKSDLYKQSILGAAFNSKLAQQKPNKIPDQDWIKILLSGYLSFDHINGKESSCPLAFLATDIAIRDSDVRDVYTRTYKNMNKLIHNYTKSYASCDEKVILAVTAMLIGSVALGRSLTDKETIEELLDSCMIVAQDLLKIT